MNFNDKLILSGLESDVANCGYEESRKEHIRLEEELAEVRRVQEVRVDEFSMQKIERKSCHNKGVHFTDTGLTRKGELCE